MSDSDDAALLEAESAEALAYQAKEVQHLLNHEGVKRAFATTEQRIFRQWRIAPSPLEREICWHKLAVFRDLVAVLTAFGDRRPT
jgi:hypothetical protein